MVTLSVVNAADQVVNTFTDATTEINLTSNGTASITTGAIDSQGSEVPSVETIYSFSMTTINIIPVNGKIRIEFPGTMTLNATPTCVSITALSSPIACAPQVPGSKNLIIDAVRTGVSPLAAGTVIRFSVSGVGNPTSAVTDSIKVYTMTETSDYIDLAGTGMIPQLQCNSPCATCQAGNKDHCLSCVAGSGLDYLQGTTCVNACDAGKTPNGGTTCVDCDASCATCEVASKS